MIGTTEIGHAILAEIGRVIARVDEQQVQGLLAAIQDARHIVVYGLGREGLVMRGFAMRLMHLGLPVAVVGDMTTPPVGPGDLFLVSCGPGYLSTVEALIEIAKSARTRVAMLTAQAEGPLTCQADLLVVLPGQTMAQTKGSSSTQAMGSVFEQAMWIFFDALVPQLQSALGQSAEDLRRRHTNLE